MSPLSHSVFADTVVAPLLLSLWPRLVHLYPVRAQNAVSCGGAPALNATSLHVDIFQPSDPTAVTDLSIASPLSVSLSSVVFSDAASLFARTIEQVASLSAPRSVE